MKENKKQKTITVFALASFFNDLGSDMVYPIWPLFVASFSGANMAILGLIDGLGRAIVSLSQALSGYLSDKIRKRKIFIWTGYLFGSLSRIGYAFSKAWPHLIFFKAFDRTGKMRDAPRDALVAEISTLKNRGRNFGWLKRMDNLGAVSGIIVSLLIFKALGFRKLFLLASLPSIIASLLIFFFIKDKKQTKIKIYQGLSFKQISKKFRWFLLLSSFFALGSFSYSFLLLYAKKFGFNIFLVPVFYLLFTAVASFASLPMGKLADRIGRQKVIIIAYLLWALTLLSILFNRYLSIILAFIFYGLHKASLEPVQKAFVSELAPSNYKASSLGGFQMIIGLCALPSSLLTGLLWDKIGLFIPLYISLGLTFTAIAMMFLIDNFV